MGWLGEPLIPTKASVNPLYQHFTKDRIEQKLFERNRDLFTSLQVVFFDTTSIYFEGEVGESVGAYGHSKDHRPDLKQMIVGVVLDAQGRPICCELLRSLYKQNGKPLERKKLYSRSFRECLPLDHILPSLSMVQVCSLLNQFDVLETEKKQLHDLICYLGVTLFGEEVRLLLGIKGFSCLTATALMADIVCVDRFPSAKNFCSYMRTASRISASNQTIHLGRVNEQGRALTCTLLTQTVTHFSKVQHFGEFKADWKGGYTDWRRSRQSS